ncbi:hypothetical protein BBJ28_00003474 [Nothophytophthora sp. Chile5]|nr:hypothetical protein BBJ28_00003474 [Nothophytophthora sp. Chile5]
MDGRSSIFARFESGRSAHLHPPLSSGVMALQVLQRAPVGGCGVAETTIDRGNVGVPTTSNWQPEHVSLPAIQPLRAVLPPLSATRQARYYDAVAVNIALVTPQFPPFARIQASPDRGMSDTIPPTPAAASQPSAMAAVVRDKLTVSPLGSSNTRFSIADLQATCSGPAKRKRIRVKTQRRRDQCRANQARYRKKRNSFANELEVTVERLREEIPLLEMQRHRLQASGQHSANNVVSEYFRLFRHGTQVPRQLQQQHAGPREWLQDSEAQHQLVFLRSTMASNVALGELCGVDALMEQWRRYSAYFANLHFQLERMEKASEDLMTASASLIVTVTESTLQHVFPYLVETERAGSGEGEEGVSLGAKLLGQRLSIPCTARFEWDDASSRVVRLETTMNFLPPLCQVLGRLEDAAVVLEHALITCESAIGKMDDAASSRHESSSESDSSRG